VSEGEDIVEKLILRCYMELMTIESRIPSASSISRRSKLTSEKEAFDMIYGDDFITKIDDSVVHNILSKYRHIHKYAGETFYEAQNMLFKDWYDFQAMIDDKYDSPKE